MSPSPRSVEPDGGITQGRPGRGAIILIVFYAILVNMTLGALARLVRNESG